MKRIIKLLLGVCLSACLILPLAACQTNNKDKITIVCTVYPQYDWTLEVLGDRKEAFEVRYLLNNGIDLHSFQPSVSDIAAISTCDLFIYTGGESDAWAETVLNTAVNKDMAAVVLTEVVEAKEEEIVEGMQEEDGEGEEEPEYDEHVWLSLKNAQIIVAEIADAICKLDAQNADAYRKNAGDYNARLAALDGEYRSAVDSGSKDTVLFGDRFPFRYLVNDYQLSYYAAFPGCSAETEASFGTLQFLINKINELDLRVILVIETSDKAVAQTLRRDSAAKNQSILVMHSCQSVTSGDISGGVTYLSIMTDNLDVLRQALA
ncbi:MAG: metal ABC transporter substrate-binding protein [Clostridiales bacterium]|nr:metal ABC transporter substrate-binding protein [Clostridiales bacterium]